jgi:osmotically-inducible protein OsmY
VTLDGTVAFHSDWLAAGDAVRRLVGVKDVDNRLVTASTDAANDVRGSIEAAIRRRAGGLGITVGYDDGTVTLEGATRSWAARSRAEEAARVSPGVTEVVNRIAVVEHTAEPAR